MTLYRALHDLHVTTVVVTGALFALRFGLVLARGRPRRRGGLDRITYVNDTLLLGAGVGLALLLRQYPLVQPWLTAKLVALLLYIALGSLALRRWPGRRGRALWGIGALATFGYLVTVALHRDPWPW